MEIGSEFWIVKNKESDKDDEKVPYWLKKFGNVVLTSSGRGAISLMLDQIEPRLKKALLPSYICDSVIIPFEKAGYELIYYDIDEHLTPQNIEIENVDIGIFFHMGYFGFPTNEKLVDIISKFRSKSVVIVEDVTHTLFSSYPKLMKNDFVIGSIRKWFGLPSGGFVASDKINHDKLVSPPSRFIDFRVTSLYQKSEYIRTMNKSLKDKYLEGFRKAEQILDEDTWFYGIDDTSQKIIQNVDINYIKNSRKENYELLFKHLQHSRGMEIIFKDIGSNVSPMFFPIYVKDDRVKLRSDLAKKEIYCPVHWPIPKQLEGQLSSKTKRIYDSILSIPCDQRYGSDDMYRIINAIKEFDL